MKIIKYFLTILAICLTSAASCFAVDDSGDLYYWPCYDLEIIFARGSGGARYETAEFDAVAEAAQKITNDYLVITMTHDLDYPAVSVDSTARLAGAFVSAGKAYSFGDSVQAGVTSLREHYHVQAENCPDMDFALVGYSQGAMVVTQAIDAFDAERLKFVMLLGDPNTYLPEGEGLFPAACDGGALSQYRIYAPNCRTYEGVFGGRRPYEAAALAGKYGLFCNRYDLICGSSKNPFKNSGHTEYASSGVISWGMNLLAKRYLKPYTPSSEPPLRSVRKFEGDLTLDTSIVDDGAFGANIDAPSEVYVWRDGDVLRLRWQAPEAAKYLLLRFNGFDLGYIEADAGEFEIRDVNFEQDYELTLAWMDSTGEIGEFSPKEAATITEEAPVIETIAEDNEAKAHSTVVVEAPTAQLRVLPAPSVVSSGNNLGFGPELSAAGVDGSRLKPIDNSGIVATPATKQVGAGLKFSDKSNIVGITMGMLGAVGTLVLFVARRRRG